MTNLKSEKGSITLFVIVSVMLIISFLISTHLILANKVKNQKEIIDQTRKIYESDKSLEEIYNEFFSKDGINPIYTVEQLLAVGSGENILVNGKMYKFSDDTSYVLMNDLIFDVDNYEEFLGEDTDWEPIDEETIDIIWNGHTITATHLNDLTKMYGAHAPLLPLEFTQIEYIESTGTQYIDSGVNLVDSIDIGFQYTSEYSKEASLFGSRETGTNYRFGLTPFSNSFLGMMGTNIFQLQSYDTSYHTLQMKASGGCYFDDTSFPNITLEGELSNINLYLFAEKNSGSIVTSKAKIFYCKLWKENVLVRDFIPCRRNSDSQLGLYDLVNDEFYTNQGTGEFRGRVDFENDFTQIEYIESTGTQYIDSGVNLVDSIDIGFQYTSEYSKEASLFGSRETGTNYRFGLTPFSNSFLGMMGTNIFQLQSYDTSYHTLQMKASGGCYFDDTSFPNITLEGELSNINLYLFAEKNSGSIVTSKAKIFYCKLWKENVLVRDFVPCVRNSDNKPGLYDKINGVFYTNQGTGEFSYIIEN